MKKISAIFLILLLSFHWYGHRLVVSYFQQVIARPLETRLDARDFNYSKLAEIRTPLNISYQTRYTQFYGEVIFDDVMHTFVKRRIKDGIIVLKSNRNQGKQVAKDAGINFPGNNNGFEDQRNQKESIPPGKFFKNVFCACENHFQDLCLNIFPLAEQKIFARASDIRGANIPVAELPPDRIS